MEVKVIAGSDLFVFMDGSIIAHATSHRLSVKVETAITTTGENDGRFQTRSALFLDASASCEGMMVYDAIESLRNAIVLGQPLTLDFGEQVAGSLDESKIYATGDFLLVRLDEEARDGDNATYSASFEHASGFKYVNV